MMYHGKSIGNSGALTVATYNIHKGIGGRDRRYRLERVVEVIAAEQPDVILLQEVDRHVRRSRFDDQPKLLARHFEDPKSGGFFFTADDAERLLARDKPSWDGAEPSGNSVHALTLLRLHAMTGRETYRERGERTLRAFGKLLDERPQAMSTTPCFT